MAEMPRVMERYAKSLEGAVEHLVHALAETALFFFVEGTPVDTNRAVSNWRVSIGGPSSTYVPSRSPGATGGSGSGWVKSDVMAAGTSAIRSWNIKGQHNKIYIQNNAPYIMKLEHGSSRTQPGAFIASGLQAMINRAKTVKILKQL
jgi:hypothetical protein